ncbi:unnamed protein product [Ranitomeya imitator]|uniref:Golgin subfamily A member 7 n=1 Tax=Ranitomeya imitator TaxID=111125 RepID=A0ABN9M1T9_9NEOB|nr:unnamed protein product [Ranitomeya imitator]
MQQVAFFLRPNFGKKGRMRRKTQRFCQEGITDGFFFPFFHLQIVPLVAMRPQAAVAGKVFIQRDYTNGTLCQFQTKFPCELENRVDRQQFEETIRKLNSLYAEAEKLGGQSYLEGCLACLTAYTIFLCIRDAL